MHEVVTSLQMTISYFVLYVVIIAIIKYSILMFYWRIFRLPSFKLPLQIMAGITTAWAIASVSHCPNPAQSQAPSLKNSTNQVSDNGHPNGMHSPPRPLGFHHQRPLHQHQQDLPRQRHPQRNHRRNPPRHAPPLPLPPPSNAITKSRSSRNLRTGRLVLSSPNQIPQIRSPYSQNTAQHDNNLYSPPRLRRRNPRRRFRFHLEPRLLCHLDGRGAEYRHRLRLFAEHEAYTDGAHDGFAVRIER